MRYILLLALSMTIIQVSAQDIIPTPSNQETQEELQEIGQGPVMFFESKVVDYGTIQQHGEPLRKLVFTNTGDAPLIIQNARGSCGCTVPTWPKKPIMPGETGELEIRYATNRLGKFSKTVTLTTNEEGVEPHVIKVQGKVLKPEDEESVPSGDGIIKSGGGK